MFIHIIHIIYIKCIHYILYTYYVIFCCFPITPSKLVEKGICVCEYIPNIFMETYMKCSLLELDD